MGMIYRKTDRGWFGVFNKVSVFPFSSIPGTIGSLYSITIDSVFDENILIICAVPLKFFRCLIKPFEILHNPGAGILYHPTPKVFSCACLSNREHILVP